MITEQEYLDALETIKQYKIEQKEYKIKNFYKSVEHLNIDLLKSDLSTRAKTILKREFNKSEVYVFDVVEEIMKHDRTYSYVLLRYRNLGRGTYDEIMKYVQPVLSLYLEK